MTPHQKEIILLLLDGHNIAAAGSRFRLRDRSGNPVRNVTPRMLAWLKKYDLLRRQRGLFLINKSKCRTWHGNSFVKRAYKGKARGPDNENTPPLEQKPA